MNLLKIRVLAETRAGGIRKLAGDIDMSEANLHRCIKSNNIQASDLEKVANIFQVPVSYFFDENKQSEININGNKNQVGNGNVIMEVQANEIEHLKRLLSEKERTIQILMKQQAEK
jgi:transcriptional regulator with XRE-family HTH domain